MTPRPRDPRCRLYVAGIGPDVDEDTLGGAFARFGPVRDVGMPRDRATGRTRGIAFVTFADARDAEAAIRALDGTVIDGRRVTVRVADDRPATPTAEGVPFERLVGRPRPDEAVVASAPEEAAESEE